MKRRILGAVKGAAARFGVQISRSEALYPWQRDPDSGPRQALDPLPPGAVDYLRWDHPRLAELQRRYAAMDPRVTRPSTWLPDKLSGDDLLYFRGDNAFVWQVRTRNLNELGYALCYYHFLSTDDEGVAAKLNEDGLFGAYLIDVAGRQVSRDLLDSARQIQFLQRHVGLGSSKLSILDIGAGYGRLAHRIEQAVGDMAQVFATDAVAASTFIAEYYLRFRGLKTARAVPLDEVDDLLGRTPIDLATNIHSFSEMTPDAVEWWVERIAASNVRYLFVVPNAGTSAGERCQTNEGFDLESLFAKYGYNIRVREPCYQDPLVQRYGIDPVSLHLFER